MEEANQNKEEDNKHEGSPSDLREEVLQKLSVQAAAQSKKLFNLNSATQSHAFWGTQPVSQFEEDNSQLEDGPIDEPKSVDDVRQTPYNLPQSFEWCDCNVDDEQTLNEIFNHLTMNYVEDDDNMFRFKYSPAFLQWALKPPGFRKDWHVGVRVKSSQKLVGFITATPAAICVNGKRIDMVEINFLCVHKQLRSKRLAPVLIMEITRRVNLQNIWQAAYTAGVVLPKPVASCRYWHRSLNPKKLIEIGFSRLAPRMTMARTIKLYRLPEEPLTPGIRDMKESDAPQIASLLNEYLVKFQLNPYMTAEEVVHWLSPRDDVVHCSVVENEEGNITDFFSFYSLPSSVLGNPQHSEFRAAYNFYTVANKTDLVDLIKDALIVAKSKNYDVFNALDLMDNSKILKELKFGIGDGTLQYYLYNWRVSKEMKPDQIGLILL